MTLFYKDKMATYLSKNQIYGYFNKWDDLQARLRKKQLNGNRNNIDCRFESIVRSGNILQKCDSISWSICSEVFYLHINDNSCDAQDSTYGLKKAIGFLRRAS